MRAGSLFSGHGQLDFGLCLAGIDHAWFCEADPWRRGILEQRWPGVPIFDDVRAVTSSVPGIDLLVGGFPCRGASTAGGREGMDHPETALWREMARTARELRPRYLLLENVANLLAVTGGDAWGEVVGDLATLGYVCSWDCLPAAAFGAPHLRDRVFLIAALADSDQAGRVEPGDGAGDGAGDGVGCAGRAALVASGVAPDPREGRRGESQQDLRQGESDAGGFVVANADGHPLREQPEPKQGSGGAAELGIAGDWGSYAGAIERWEEVAGPAPEPLLRGVDARPARRVVRSRLSALGDGVQVQAGEFLGRRILEHEKGSLR